MNKKLIRSKKQALSDELTDIMDGPTDDIYLILSRKPLTGGSAKKDQRFMKILYFNFSLSSSSSIRNGFKYLITPQKFLQLLHHSLLILFPTGCWTKTLKNACNAANIAKKYCKTTFNIENKSSVLRGFRSFRGFLKG